jgi:hypothetical protein
MSKALSLDLRTRVLAAIAGNSKFSIFDGKINEDVADRPPNSQSVPSSPASGWQRHPAREQTGMTVEEACRRVDVIDGLPGYDDAD